VVVLFYMGDLGEHVPGIGIGWIGGAAFTAFSALRDAGLVVLVCELGDELLSWEELYLRGMYDTLVFLRWVLFSPSDIYSDLELPATCHVSLNTNGWKRQARPNTA
jgi:hypothetical protein